MIAAPSYSSGLDACPNRYRSRASVSAGELLLISGFRLSGSTTFLLNRLILFNRSPCVSGLPFHFQKFKIPGFFFKNPYSKLFPAKMVVGHRRPPISPSPSRAILQSKLTKLVSRHEQMKISYQQLKSQIDTGLHQVPNRIYHYQLLASIFWFFFGFVAKFIDFVGRRSVCIFGDSVDEACWFKNCGNGQ